MFWPMPFIMGPPISREFVVTRWKTAVRLFSDCASICAASQIQVKFWVFHYPIDEDLVAGNPGSHSGEQAQGVLYPSPGFRRTRRDGTLRAEHPVNVCIAVWPWGAYLGDEGIKNGIRAKVSSFTRHHVNVMMTKSKAAGNYINSVLAKTEVKNAGYDEAIMLDAEGYVSEAGGENIFIVRDKQIENNAAHFNLARHYSGFDSYLGARQGLRSGGGAIHARRTLRCGRGLLHRDGCRNLRRSGRSMTALSAPAGEARSPPEIQETFFDVIKGKNESIRSGWLSFSGDSC